MPKLTIEVDQRAWQRLREQAALQGLTPEALAQQLLLGQLHAPHKSSRKQNRDRKHSTELLSNEQLRAAAALPRGSLQRVLTTLNLLDTLIPLHTPPPSRELGRRFARLRPRLFAQHIAYLRQHTSLLPPPKVIVDGLPRE